MLIPVAKTTPTHPIFCCSHNKSLTPTIRPTPVPALLERPQSIRCPIAHRKGRPTCPLLGCPRSGGSPIAHRRDRSPCQPCSGVHNLAAARSLTVGADPMPTLLRRPQSSGSPITHRRGRPTCRPCSGVPDL